MGSRGQRSASAKKGSVVDLTHRKTVEYKDGQGKMRRVKVQNYIKELDKEMCKRHNVGGERTHITQNSYINNLHRMPKYKQTALKEIVKTTNLLDVMKQSIWTEGQAKAIEKWLKQPTPAPKRKSIFSKW